jgi:hypothetical protein
MSVNKGRKREEEKEILNGVKKPITPPTCKS